METPRLGTESEHLGLGKLRGRDPSVGTYIKREKTNFHKYLIVETKNIIIAYSFVII